MKIKTARLAIVLQLSLGAITSAPAVVLSWDVEKPTTDVFHSYDPSSPSGAYSWFSRPDANREVAQTFTLAANSNDFLLSTITLRLGADLTTSFPSTASFTLAIYSVPSATPSTPNPIGTLLGSETGVIVKPTVAMSEAGSYFQLTLNTPIILNASPTGTTAFSFVLTFDSPASDQQISLASTSPQIAGNRIVGRENGGAWVYPGATSTFLLQGTAIPEPGAVVLSLLGVGVILLSVANRKRGRATDQ